MSACEQDIHKHFLLSLAEIKQEREPINMHNTLHENKAPVLNVKRISYVATVMHSKLLLAEVNKLIKHFYIRSCKMEYMREIPSV